MFGHNGDDYDEELVVNEHFVIAANQMFSENYNRSQIYQKLIGMKCNSRVADKICKHLEEMERKRRINYEKFVKLQSDVRMRNRQENDLKQYKERKIGISKIRDDYDDYERTR